MSKDTKPGTVQQPLGEPPYRVAPGGERPETWVVAEGTIDKPGPAVAMGFATKAAAQAVADRLNALAETFEAGSEKRRDEVLGRMMHSSKLE